MRQLERIGVSLEQNLLSAFDKLIGKQGYKNRSEAIRDLIRQQLSSQRLSNPKAEAVGAVLLVYDHHATKLMEKLTDLQHSHLMQIISTVHIHLDADNCMEIVVLRGRAGEIKRTAEKMLSRKGVKVGRINLIGAEQH